jgi:hypothetical protein
MDKAHRDHLFHLANPRRDELVWESAEGPVLVAEMPLEHLRAALAFCERTAYESPALPAVRERYRRLCVAQETP